MADDRLLGQGTHGSVYDNLDGGLTVTKYINIMELSDGGRVMYMNQTVIAEPCALKRLKECGVPYIVDLKSITVNSTGTDLKIIMERCDPLFFPKVGSEDDVRKMIAQLFMAVEGMHQVGVYHGDIKTDNVMRDRIDGHLRVIDFSLAHVDSPEVTERWEELYTMGYRPPEILLGSPHIEREKADVWAAGVTACDMLLGKKAFMRQIGWKESLHEIVAYFGNMPYGIFYPRWLDFVHSTAPSDIIKQPIHDLIKAANHSDAAADFIACACDLNPRRRWSSRKLLSHPYIEDLTTNCPLRKDLYPLQKVVIRDRPRPHRLFVVQRNAERELLTDELIKRLKCSRDNERVYIAAMNICSNYILECDIPLYTDAEAIANLLMRPETFELLSKHIFVQDIDD